MSLDLFDSSDGATPLTYEDSKGLVPTWIATRDDLNIAEYENIKKAVAWLDSKAAPKNARALLAEPMMRILHRRMFGDVWSWAGTYRTHETNIGVCSHLITTEVKNLVDDVNAQIINTDKLPWKPDELAVRFHHRLVSIHPFANGNGRHSRLATDELLKHLGGRPFSWGSGSLSADSEVRQIYLAALREADAEYDYDLLVQFARS